MIGYTQFTDDEEVDIDQAQEYKAVFQENAGIKQLTESLGASLSQDMFEAQHLDYGICCVTLMHEGKKVKVVIDDFLPCIDFEPIYGQNQSDALWVSMVEKAIAKLRGNYAEISDGQSFVKMI